MTSLAVNKNNEQLEGSNVLIQGLPPRGVHVDSVDGFGMKDFSALELELAIRRGVALQNQPIRAVSGRSKSSQPQLSRLGLFLPN